MESHKIYAWDFNVFEVKKQHGGRPLLHVTMALLEDNGLLDGWLLDRSTMEAYLAAAEQIYRDNPYHNSTHAADVTQTAGVIMTAVHQHLSGGSSPPANGRTGSGSGSSSSTTTSNSGSSSRAPATSSCGCCKSCCCGGGSASSAKGMPAAAGAAPAAAAAGAAPPPAAGGGLSKLERFAIILASAVHDLGHPGVNNAYLVRTRDAQALNYNDRSVNENMHASLAFKLALDRPGLNLFSAFSQEEYDTVRKLVLDMVLATDMDVHFKLLQRFADELAAAPDVRAWASLEQRSLLFQMLVHLADLANPARPWPLALAWAEGVVREFLSQGTKEAAAGIPVSPPCDASKVNMPAAQLFFIERFCAPTLEAFRPAAPSFYEMAAPWLADTRGRWSAFHAAGVRFPGEGYPSLPPRSAAEQGALWTALGGRAICCGACKQHSRQPSQLAGAASSLGHASAAAAVQHQGAAASSVASLAPQQPALTAM